MADSSYRVLVLPGRFFDADNRYDTYFLFTDGDIVWKEPMTHGEVLSVQVVSTKTGEFIVTTTTGRHRWQAHRYRCEYIGLMVD